MGEVNEKGSDSRYSAGGLATLSQTITLTDGAFKRVAYDAYSIQYANGKGYMWIASAIFAANFVVFKAAPADAETWSKLLLLLPLATSSLSSFIAFMCAATMAHGTSKTEPFSNSAEWFSTPMTEEEAYETRRGILKNLNDAINQEMDLMEKRGRTLRHCGRDIQIALSFTLIAVILYLFLYW